MCVSDFEFDLIHTVARYIAQHNLSNITTMTPKIVKHIAFWLLIKRTVPKIIFQRILKMTELVQSERICAETNL